MNKYKIKEVRKTLVNGEVEYVFYIYKPYLFFWRKYDTYRSRNDPNIKLKYSFSIIHSALARIKEAEEQDRVNSAKKVKKIETIIHKL